MGKTFKMIYIVSAIIFLLVKQRANLTEKYFNRVFLYLAISIDIWGNTHSKNGEFAQGAATEHIKQSEEITAAEKLFNDRSVYARNRYMCSSPEYDKHC